MGTDRSSAPSYEANFIVDRDFRLGEIDPRLYGAFLEHLGRAMANPGNVVHHNRGSAALFAGSLTAALPTLSWNVIRIARHSTGV